MEGLTKTGEGEGGVLSHDSGVDSGSMAEKDKERVLS